MKKKPSCIRLSAAEKEFCREKSLSPRESDVVMLVPSMTMIEIGERLGIKYNTVKMFMDRLRNKMGVRKKDKIAQIIVLKFPHRRAK